MLYRYQSVDLHLTALPLCKIDGAKQTEGKYKSAKLYLSKVLVVNLFSTLGISVGNNIRNCTQGMWTSEPVSSINEIPLPGREGYFIVSIHCYCLSKLAILSKMMIIMMILVSASCDFGLLLPSDRAVICSVKPLTSYLLADFIKRCGI